MENHQPSQDRPIFAARLTPHRSLSRNGFLILMAFVGLISFCAGVMFLKVGAWPVIGFFGLDVLIFWFAFQMNYRSGRVVEELAVWPHQLTVRQTAPSGRRREYRLNPFWTRFRVDRHAEFGITRMTLASRQGELSIGSFLNPVDRESFAVAFGQALARARRG